MIRRAGRAVAIAALAAACTPESGVRFAGSTDWDRNAVLAEASEPVLDWHVAEGDRVEAGDLLLRLDTGRQDARIEAAAARLAYASAQLAELEAGPREETILRARAELSSAEAALVEAELQFARADELLRRNLTAESNVDQARATRDQRRAALAAREAELAELLAGTRAEELDQARAHLRAVSAELEELRLTRRRLEVTAPRRGRVDALPFKPGDQPPEGAVLVSLLVGDAPIARIFIPASERARFREGDRFAVTVEGVDSSLLASLRSIRSEASFTPYYALTGDDASRLVYRAELVFQDPQASELPAGLPLVATPLPAAGSDD